MAKALMLQGTGSDVGKSVLVAGLCRAAKRRGISVLPFKPQNMSNNAAVAEADIDGAAGEIGRAQWLQALAAGVAPSVHMNPVLLKPQSQTGSQVVVQGKLRGNVMARQYQEMKRELLGAVMESFAILSQRADLILVEGAGSPAEINLRAGDIANMGFATRANVPVVLVGDIDRGGVIASLVGTHTILPPEERAMVKGFVINKFRGDLSLFGEGLAAITKFTGWRALGILPWQAAVGRLPAEDSVALDTMKRVETSKDALTIAVPVMSKIANFDDLDPLRQTPGINLQFILAVQPLPKDAALVILPGSKSTIADLGEFRANGWEADLLGHMDRGGRVIGICGGYQMLGKKVSDPDGIEGSEREIAGLGLLDVETVLAGDKQVKNTSAHSLEYGLELQGYEIHMGRTHGPDCARPMLAIGDERDGAISPDGKVRGSYLHGIFNNDQYRAALLRELGAGLDATNHAGQVDAALNELADAIEEHLDVAEMLNLAR